MKFELMLMEAEREGFIKGYVKSFAKEYAETFREIFGDKFEEMRIKLLIAGEATAFASLIDDGTLTLSEAVEKFNFPGEIIEKFFILYDLIKKRDEI